MAIIGNIPYFQTNPNESLWLLRGMVEIDSKFLSWQVIFEIICYTIFPSRLAGELQVMVWFIELALPETRGAPNQSVLNILFPCLWMEAMCSIAPVIYSMSFYIPWLSPHWCSNPDMCLSRVGPPYPKFGPSQFEGILHTSGQVWGALREGLCALCKGYLWAFGQPTGCLVDDNETMR